MQKKKLKRQSGEALLSEVRKEMAQPRVAASTRSDATGASCRSVDGMFPARFACTLTKPSFYHVPKPTSGFADRHLSCPVCCHPKVRAENSASSSSETV
jgi:hypothetical protein